MLALERPLLLQVDSHMHFNKNQWRHGVATQLGYDLTGMQRCCKMEDLESSH